MRSSRRTRRRSTHASAIMPRGSCANTTSGSSPCGKRRSDARTEFVYLLQWPDERTKTAAWAKFMADAEWAEIKRLTAAEHGRLVGEIADRILHQVDYSPQLVEADQRRYLAPPNQRTAN